MTNIDNLISYIKQNGLLTGSRAFFEFSLQHSDWDYVIQDTPMFAEMFEACRNDLQSISLPGSNVASIRFKYKDQIYDIVVVSSFSERSFNVWKTATMEMIRLCKTSRIFSNLLLKRKDLRILIFRALCGDET